jgi:hypothetical protein
MAHRSTGTRSRRTARTRATAQTRLRVSFDEADRVRRHLLSDQVGVLSTRDIRTLLHILNDVYPPPGPRSHRSGHATVASPGWQPFLLGMGIGLALLVGALAIV